MRAAALLLLLAALPAAARDRGQYGATDPATRAWFKGLHSAAGTWCCDEADGMRVEDPNWRLAGDHYEVFRNGAWEAVPVDALVTAKNKVGFAVLWAPPAGRILCFMPGAAG